MNEREILTDLLLEGEIKAEESGFFNCCRSRPHMELVADYLLNNGIKIIPIVKCKDCKYAYINSFSKASGVVFCKYWTDRTDGYKTVMQNDDYCCYGENK